MLLKDKVAIITGAASARGLGFCDCEIIRRKRRESGHYRPQWRSQ